MEEPKVINNTAIMKSKKRIVEAINNEINNNAIPVSIISMILHGCTSEVDMLLNQAIAAETNAAAKEKDKSE